MEYYNKQICVTIEDLTQGPAGGEPVMSLPNYKQLVARKRLKVVRKGGGLGSYVLIDYATMPERFRERFETLIGKPEEILKAEQAGEALPIDGEAQKFYQSYITPTGVGLSDERIEEYTINASVIKLGSELYRENKQYQKSINFNNGSAFNTILGTIEELRKNPGHTLPTNPVRLRQKFNEFKREGYACLISRKYGNRNTEKITPSAGRQIVALKRCRVPVYTNEQIFREFNRIAIENGWKPLKSINSLTSYLGRPEIEPLWYDAVHGEQAAMQKYGRKHKTIRSNLRDALWYSDGTKLNLYYKGYNKAGELVMKTTQVYEVMDSATEVFLGYHISDKENFMAQYYAFRMAIEYSGQKPYEIVTDNQGGHKKMVSTGFLDKIKGSIGRQTMPWSPQSKSIESAFGRFQAQILHRDWRFTGQNITARSKSSHANLEFIGANEAHLYTLPELKAAYARARMEWNLSPHPVTGRPRLEMYQESVNPKAVPVSALDMVDMFWFETEEASTFTSSGITIQINNKKYTYEVLDARGMPDMEFRRIHTGRRFFVRYDPLDMTHVRLYVQDATGKRFVADARPYIEIHRAQQDQLEGELSFIHLSGEQNKRERIRRQIEAAALEMEHGVAPEQFGLNRPRIKGVSAGVAEKYMLEIATNHADQYEAPWVPEEEPSQGEPEPIELGAWHKAVSNQTHDQISRYDKF